MIAKITANFIDVIFYNIKNNIFLLFLLVTASLAGLVLSAYLEKDLFVIPNDFILYEKKEITATGNKNYSYFRDIERYSIFKEIEVKKVKPKVVNNNNGNNSKKLAAIKKNLVLRGTLILGSLKFAILYHSKKNKEESFKINSKVFETDAVLKNVEKDKVLLAIGSNTSYLEIDKKKTDISIIKKEKKERISSKPTNATKIPSLSSIKTGDKRLDDLIKSGGDESFNFEQEDAIKLDNNNVTVKKAYFDGALKNLPLMLSQAKAVPHLKNKEFIGYRLANVDKSGIFAKLGLKKNDIITSVNGEKVDNITQVMRFFSILQNEKFINVGLIRESTPIIINFSLI